MSYHGMGVRHYEIFGRKFGAVGWAVLYTGKGYLTGKGFDVHERFVEIGWPRRSSFFRPFLKWITDVRIDT